MFLISLARQSTLSVQHELLDGRAQYFSNTRVTLLLDRSRRLNSRVILLLERLVRPNTKIPSSDGKHYYKRNWVDELVLKSILFVISSLFLQRLARSVEAENKTRIMLTKEILLWF